MTNFSRDFRHGLTAFLPPAKMATAAVFAAPYNQGG